MKTIAIGQFKATCLKVLEQVNKSKQPLIVTKRGIPLVRILPTTEDIDRTSLIGSIIYEDELILPALDDKDWDASK